MYGMKYGGKIHLSSKAEVLRTVRETELNLPDPLMSNYLPEQLAPITTANDENIISVLAKDGYQIIHWDHIFAMRHLRDMMMGCRAIVSMYSDMVLTDGQIIEDYDRGDISDHLADTRRSFHNLHSDVTALLRQLEVDLNKHTPR